MIYLKTEEEIELLRENNILVSKTLAEVGRHIKPGVTTKQLDKIIEDFIRSHGATPAFLGYQGYPASACISINEQVVHGIPSDNIVIKEGDIVSVDVGTFMKGFVGDSAYTFAVGEVAEEVQQLMAYLKPFENGVFVPQYGYGRSHYRVHRYINGCHTNEWYAIDCESEEVTSSEYRFEDGDFENLPNLSGYIESLDLTKIAPPHMDPSGKELLYNHAAGWYEKTAEGVYSIVKIAWRYQNQKDYFVQYYDEMFILLDEDGDHLISREDLIARIGENGNISSREYGAAIAIPVA